MCLGHQQSGSEKHERYADLDHFSSQMVRPRFSRQPKRRLPDRMVDVDPRLASRFRSFSRTASLLAALIGAVALVGWVAGVDVLRSGIPGLVGMKINTALCLVASGLALWTLADLSAGPRARIAAHSAALGVALLSLLVLSQYLLRVGRWGGRAPLRRSAHRPGDLHPGRMAPNTAFAFVMVALALLCLDRRLGRYRPAAALAALAGLVSYAALLGYMSEITRLYGVSRLSQMRSPRR